MLQKSVPPGDEKEKLPDKLDLSGLEELAEKAAKATEQAKKIEKKQRKGGLYCCCGKPITRCDIGPFHYRFQG